MGNIFMSVYMIHMQVQPTVQLLGIKGILGVIVSAFLSILGGWILTHWFEKPIETLIRGSKRVVRPPEKNSSTVGPISGKAPYGIVETELGTIPALPLTAHS